MSTVGFFLWLAGALALGSAGFAFKKKKIKGKADCILTTTLGLAIGATLWGGFFIMIASNRLFDA